MTVLFIILPLVVLLALYVVPRTHVTAQRWILQGGAIVWWLVALRNWIRWVPNPFGSSWGFSMALDPVVGLQFEIALDGYSAMIAAGLATSWLAIVFGGIWAPGMLRRIGSYLLLACAATATAVAAQGIVLAAVASSAAMLALWGGLAAGGLIVIDRRSRLLAGLMFAGTASLYVIAGRLSGELSAQLQTQTSDLLTLMRLALGSTEQSVLVALMGFALFATTGGTPWFRLRSEVTDVGSHSLGVRIALYAIPSILVLAFWGRYGVLVAGFLGSSRFGVVLATIVLGALLLRLFAGRAETVVNHEWTYVLVETIWSLVVWLPLIFWVLGSQWGARAVLLSAYGSGFAILLVALAIHVLHLRSQDVLALSRETFAGSSRSAEPSVSLWSLVALAVPGAGLFASLYPSLYGIFESGLLLAESTGEWGRLWAPTALVFLLLAVFAVAGMRLLAGRASLALASVSGVWVLVAILGISVFMGVRAHFWMRKLEPSVERWLEMQHRDVIVMPQDATEARLQGDEPPHIRTTFSLATWERHL